jgi:transcriptional antiterminator Rof (Rho-off)
MSSISCRLYDQLESAIVKKQPLKIELKTDSIFEGCLVDLQVKNSQEYGLTDSGEWLLLSDIKVVELL